MAKNPEHGKTKTTCIRLGTENWVKTNPKLLKAVTRLYLIGISSYLSQKKASNFLYHSIYIDTYTKKRKRPFTLSETPRNAIKTHQRISITTQI